MIRFMLANRNTRVSFKTAREAGEFLSLWVNAGAAVWARGAGTPPRPLQLLIPWSLRAEESAAPPGARQTQLEPWALLHAILPKTRRSDLSEWLVLKASDLHLDFAIGIRARQGRMEITSQPLNDDGWAFEAFRTLSTLGETWRMRVCRNPRCRGVFFAANKKRHVCSVACRVAYNRTPEARKARAEGMKQHRTGLREMASKPVKVTKDMLRRRAGR